MRIYLSAGEASGDHLGASIAAALGRLRPDAVLEGYGGPAMAAAGVDIRYDLPKLAVMGVLPVLKHLPLLRRLLAETRAYLARERPDAAVLIDYPGWHFVVAKEAKRLGVPVVQVVAPQLWAWAPWRIRKVRRRIDRLLVVLPFEEVWFRARGVDARYIGHPLIERLTAGAPGLAPPAPDAPPAVGLLPGSREQEWRRLLPLFLRVATRLRRSRPGLAFRIACARDAFRPAMEAMVRASGLAVPVEVGETHRIQRDARVVLTSSGSATLETTFFETPMVVAYPVDRVSKAVARYLVTAPHIALANLLAGRALVPEFLVSGDASAEIAAAVDALLDDGPARDAVRAGLRQVKSSLETESPSNAAAREILDAASA